MNLNSTIMALRTLLKKIPEDDWVNNAQSFFNVIKQSIPKQKIIVFLNVIKSKINMPINVTSLKDEYYVLFAKKIMSRNFELSTRNVYNLQNKNIIIQLKLLLDPSIMPLILLKDEFDSKQYKKLIDMLSDMTADYLYGKKTKENTELA